MVTIGGKNESSCRLAVREGYLSIIGNLLLFAFKLYVGMVCGSVAIIADAWHTLSDAASSVVVILGARLSLRPADREHPFGHGRFEIIAAFVIGMMLSAVAWDFLVDSIRRLIHPSPVDFGMLALWATLGGILVKEAMAQYAFHVARTTGMSSVRADGWHHRSDAASSVIVLIGIISSCLMPAGASGYVDGFLGAIVSLIIAYAACTVLKRAVKVLLGASPDPTRVAEFEKLCRGVGGAAIECHHFHLHDYGGHSELTLHVRIPGASSLFEAHRVATRLENEFAKRFNIQATCHVEPLEEHFGKGES